jgi:hypothetical protein
MKIIENLLNFTLSLVRLILGFRFFNSPIKILKNEKSTEKVLILGNGPSLNQTEESNGYLFHKFDLIAVNRFPETPAFEKYKPKFLVLLAHIFYLPDAQLSEEFIEANKLLFESLKTKTSWNLTIIVPANHKKSKRLNDLLANNKNINTYFIKANPIEGFTWFRHLGYQFRLGMPRPHNVLIPSLMVALQANYSQIAIVGADHSWLSEISVNDTNQVFVHQKHFYDQSTSEPKQMNDYIIRPRRLHEVLHKFYLSFRGYWEIKTYAEKKKIEIYNCSETSMIDAFERKPLTEF